MKKYKEFAKTAHGIQLKKIVNMSFPGNEWGPDSGTVCEIWYKGKHFANFENRADGGEVNIDYVNNPSRAEIQQFLNDLKADIPQEYYLGVEETYKKMGDYIYNQYKDILKEERERKEGKPADILALIDIGEMRELEKNKKRGKK